MKWFKTTKGFISYKSSSIKWHHKNCWRKYWIVFSYSGPMCQWGDVVRNGQATSGPEFSLLFILNFLEFSRLKILTIWTVCWGILIYWPECKAELAYKKKVEKNTNLISHPLALWKETTSFLFLYLIKSVFVIKFML